MIQKPESTFRDRTSILIAGGIVLIGAVMLGSAAYIARAAVKASNAATATAVATSTQAAPDAYATVRLIGESAIVYDLKTGETLYAQDADHPLPLASIT